MRRKQCEVTDFQKIQQILDSTNIGRLAIIGGDGHPYITPVNFVRYSGNIYFHCAPQSEKLDNLKRNPKVCFTVDVPLAYLVSRFDQKQHVCSLSQFYHCVRQNNISKNRR